MSQSLGGCIFLNKLERNLQQEELQSEEVAFIKLPFFNQALMNCFLDTV